MRFGIFSDVHGHLLALETVLEDMERQAVTQYACLGDIVGRGEGAKECLELIQSLGCPIVQGNHDYYAAELPDADFYERTSRLTSEDRAFLGALPLVLEVDSFTIVHTSLDRPNDWRYVETAERAKDSFQLQMTDLAFSGHTHIPQIFVAVGHRLRCQVEKLPFKGKVQLLPGRRYFINPGSVGEPRDGDPRPAYLIYDSESKTVELRRLPPFDFDWP